MTLISYDYNKGPEGAALAATDFTPNLTVSLGGGTVVYEAASAWEGAFGITIRNAAGASTIIRHPVATADGNPLEYSFSVPYTRDAAPVPTSGTITNIIQFRPITGAAWAVYWSNDNTIFARDSVGAEMGTLLSGAVPGTKYRLRGWLNQTTAEFSMGLYDGATLIGNVITQTTNATVKAFSTGGLATIQVGAFTATAASVQRTDNVVINGGTRTIPPLPGAAAVVLRPQAVNGTVTGTFDIIGGSATRGEALADNTDATLVRSGLITSTAQVIELPLTAGVPDAGAQSNTVRLRKTDDGPCTVTVELRQGATLRKSWTVTPTTTWAAYPLPLTEAEVSTIRTANTNLTWIARVVTG